MGTRRALILSLAAGIVGVILGRALPHETPGASAVPGTASSPPAAMPPLDCKAERAELTTTRARLAICMAYCPTAVAPEPTVATAPEPTERLAPALAELMRQTRYTEVVYVRRHDGTVRAYRAAEWSPDGSEQIFARSLPDGRIVGPDGEPTVYRRLRDLAGPDGAITYPDGNKVEVAKPDAGAP